MLSTYFNPRTREGCDEITVYRQWLYRISIHAPAKGATMAIEKVLNVTPEFQSTHPRRVRLPFSLVFTDLTHISIHAPAKGATGIDNFDYAIIDISIHAPAKGATTSFTVTLSIPSYFNPRTREGCDIWHQGFPSSGKIVFQSTHPRRVRRG